MSALGNWIDIVEAGSGEHVRVPIESIGALVSNSAETSVTVYFDFEVPTQGNNTAPVVVEVTGQDALDLLAFFRNRVKITVAGAAPP